MADGGLPVSPSGMSGRTDPCPFSCTVTMRSTGCGTEGIL